MSAARHPVVAVATQPLQVLFAVSEQFPTAANGSPASTAIGGFATARDAADYLNWKSTRHIDRTYRLIRDSDGQVLATYHASRGPLLVEV